VANPKPKRRSRKRRKPGGAARVAGPRPVRRTAIVTGTHSRRAPATPFGPYGERPPSPFGGVPVSEIAIFAGGVGFVIGFITGRPAALVVGAIVCALGVLEVTAREHFSGYRSHSMLLAAFPTVAVETAVVLLFGEPSDRILLLPLIVPVFGGLFWWLRKRFLVARQARIARLG
jgi:hypothetical protein